MTRKVKSADELCRDYATKWSGWRMDGKGILVPDRKDTWKKYLATRSAEIQIPSKEKAVEQNGKLYITGVANAKEVDRMDEVVEPAGGMFDSYKKNSVLLYQHNHFWPMGLVTTLRPEDSGTYFDAWVGDPQQAPLTKMQEECRSLIAQRILKAVSIGFIPLKIRMPSYSDQGAIVDPAVIEQWEMLELSVVSVPCNANALFDLKENLAGEMDEKELDEQLSKLAEMWGFPKDRKGATFLTKPKGVTDMEEMKELFAKLTLALEGISAGIKSIQEGQDGLKSAVADAVKGKKPKEDPADEDESKKALTQLSADVAAFAKRIEGIEADQKNILGSIEILAKKVTEGAA